VSAHHSYAESVAARYAEFRAAVVIPLDTVDAHWRRPPELKDARGLKAPGEAPRAMGFHHKTRKIHKRRREW
jgi:hypothetical protein